MDNTENYFQKKLLDSLEVQRIPYDQTAWDRLSRELDDTNPKKKQSIFGYYWVLLLLPLLAWNISLQKKLSNIENTQNQIVAKEIVSVKKDTVIRYVDKIIYVTRPNNTKTIASIKSDLASNNSSNSNKFSIAFEKSSSAYLNENQPIASSINEMKVLKNENESFDKMICSEMESLQNSNKIDELAVTNKKINTEDIDNIYSYPIKKIKKQNSKISNEISIGMLQTANVATINEQAYQIALSTKLWKNFSINLGLQYNNANFDANHHEIAAIYPIPLPHQNGDIMSNINYNSNRISLPILLNYSFLPENKFSPYIFLGDQIQYQTCSKIAFNYFTKDHDLYTINKKIMNNSWSNSLIMGGGITFPVYQKIKGFGALQCRKAISSNGLLNAEKLVGQFIVGLKIKI